MRTERYVDNSMCMCMMCMSSNCIMRLLYALKRKTFYSKSIAQHIQIEYAIIWKPFHETLPFFIFEKRRVSP